MHGHDLDSSRSTARPRRLRLQSGIEAAQMGGGGFFSPISMQDCTEVPCRAGRDVGLAFPRRWVFNNSAVSNFLNCSTVT